MTTSKEKSVEFKSSNEGTKLLVKEFYHLRKTFESEYSGKLRSHKYEETREFTIELNHSIFEANQMLLIGENIRGNSENLKVQLKRLRKKFQDLVQ